VELDFIVFVERRVAIERVAAVGSRADEYKLLISKGNVLPACTAMSVGTGPIAALGKAEENGRAEERGEEKEKTQGTTILCLPC
jgi:hypothetical protein